MAKNSPPTKPNNLVQTIERVSLILEMVGQNPQGMSIRCLGAPIFDGTERTVAAISVSGPVFQMTRKVVRDVVKKEVMAAASEISRRLGFK